jgi:hypothetical protein
LWDVEAPTFSRQSAHRWRWGCQPYAPAAVYPQEDTLYSFLFEAESTVGSYCIWQGWVNWKSNELIGNRTRDLPACSIVPRSSTLPLQHRRGNFKTNIIQPFILYVSRIRPSNDFTIFSSFRICLFSVGYCFDNTLTSRTLVVKLCMTIAAKLHVCVCVEFNVQRASLVILYATLWSTAFPVLLDLYFYSKRKRGN